MAFAPISGSHSIPPNVLRKFQLDSYDDDSVRSQRLCRQSCSQAVETKLSSTNLTSLLLAYSQELIEKNAIGYNCTGLTTLKFPVRVKAKLGSMALGNVSDSIQVINHEKMCF